MNIHQFPTPPVKRAKPRSAPPPAPGAKRRRLMLIAGLMLAISLSAAGLDYWIETRQETASLEDLLPGSERLARRQMGMLYGPSASLSMDISAALRRPGTHALLIIAAGLLTGGVCLRLAQVSDDDQEFEIN